MFLTNQPGDGVSDEEGGLEHALAAPALVDDVVGHGEVGVGVVRVAERGVQLQRCGAAPLHTGVQRDRLGHTDRGGSQVRGHVRSAGSEIMYL